MAGSVRVSVSLDQAQIDNMLTGPSGPVRKMMNSASAEVYVAMHGLVPRRTGVLMNSLDIEEQVVPGRSVTVRIGSDRLRAYWTERGTGPGRIFPKRSPYLSFRTRSGGWVKAQSVAPQKAQNWMWRSLGVLRNRFVVKRGPGGKPTGGWRP